MLLLDDRHTSPVVIKLSPGGMLNTHVLAVTLRDQQDLGVAGKHAGRVDHHPLLVLRVEHLHGGRRDKTSTSILCEMFV